MSQDRMDISKSDTINIAPTYAAPDIDVSLSLATKAMSKVRVVHGANEKYFDNLEGKTVGMVRKSLREAFNIPGDAEALISGKAVQDDFVLEGGMNLEFVKEAGVKGWEQLNRKLGMLQEKSCQKTRYTLTKNMLLVERHYTKGNNEIARLYSLSKELYNRANFLMR